MSDEQGEGEIVVAEEELEKDETVVVRKLRQLVMTSVNEGVGPITGSVDYAEARLASIVGKRHDAGPYRDLATPEEIERVITRLINESFAASAATGFVTGLGGFVTMPITLPANIAGALMINARLAGAVAYLRGYDLKDPLVETFVVLVVAGGSAAKAVGGVSVAVGTKMTTQLIKSIPMSAIHAINRKAGMALVAKYGTKRAAVTLAKGVPLVGGALGGAVDATLTKLVGKAARSSFPVQWGTQSQVDAASFAE